jgi:hypothetical protein
MSKIKTWQERSDEDSRASKPVEWPKVYMEAEIAELRAALASSATTEQPLRYTSDGELAECPCCGSLDVGGAHSTVHCYTCALSMTRTGPLQNAMDAWNLRAKAAAPVTNLAAVIRQLQPKMPDYRDYALDSHERGCHRDGYRAGFKSALAAAASLATLEAPPVAHLKNLHPGQLYDICCRQAHAVKEADKCIKRYQEKLAQAEAAALAKQVPAQEQDKWVSVNDRLPELYTEVMVWPHPTDYCNTAEMDRKGWYYGEYVQHHGHENVRLDWLRVTHWMPLPPAPAQLAQSADKAEG